MIHWWARARLKCKIGNHRIDNHKIDDRKIDMLARLRRKT